MKTINLQSLMRDSVKKLRPYSSARDDFQGIASIYLDANENPFDTPYNRYPDPHQVDLKKAIALAKNVQPEQIFLGNGSDEPIDLLMRAFCEPARDNILIPVPTYPMFSVSAAINAVGVKTVNLTSDFDLDLPSIQSSWNQHTKFIFVCSPNNPTGNLLSTIKIKSLLQEFNGLVVVDEAYLDFTDTAGFIPFLDSFNNLVVLQTFSKAWGLASIRLGMCFAHAEIIHTLNTIKPPYNISTQTQSVALEYLRDTDRKNEWVIDIKKQRELLRVSLTELSVVEHVYPSDANFLLVKVKNAKQTYDELLAHGIIVRNRSNVVLCENCLRITVGTELHNRELISVMRQL